MPILIMKCRWSTRPRRLSLTSPAAVVSMKGSSASSASNREEKIPTSHVHSRSSIYVSPDNVPDCSHFSACSSAFSAASMSGTSTAREQHLAEPVERMTMIERLAGQREAAPRTRPRGRWWALLEETCHACLLAHARGLAIMMMVGDRMINCSSCW